MRRKRTILAVLALGVVAASAAYFLLARGGGFDTRFTGAYRLDDGRLVIVAPREGPTLRYRLMSGATGALRPAGGLAYEAGPGWSDAEAVTVAVTFDEPAAGPPAGLDWRDAGGAQRGRRLELPEVAGRFSSGELELRAKLVLPRGEGPFPAVVFVHGSGSESAVDSYYNPYLTAAHGVAGLVYDKRGTGGSDGSYSQNFHRLSDDAAAAVEWLRGRPEIDGDNVHLAGYSQGGWIAPLAATKTSVRSLLVCYGPMVPVTGEDRWGYVYALREAGFGEQAVREVDALDAIASAILDRRENRWRELRRALAAAEEAAWYEAVKGSDSLVGFLTGTALPLPAVRVWAWWMARGDEPFIDRLYDPVPTVASLDVPSLWIFGGRDSSMPSGWSIAELEKLAAAGRPVAIEVFPEAEHGILLFEEVSGERELRGYAPGFLPLQVDWLRRQSGLESSGI